MFPRGLLISIGVVIFLVAGTTVAIYWARGYRPNLKDATFLPTGLLVANSFPTGAQVYINDKLTTATDNTINLAPGDYKIKIVKDGYLSWEKNLKLQKELVTQTNTLLFPAAPDLKALTYVGITNPVPSPDGRKIAFVILSSNSADKNGLYILDLSNRTLSFKSETRQIAKLEAFNFEKAKFIWSPDSVNLLAWQENLTGEIVSSVLLDVNKMNDVLPDQTAKISVLLDEWETDINLKTKERIAKLPKKLDELLKNNSTNLYWSPDEEKLLFTATASATIPDGLIAALPASNTQPQTRALEQGKIYVYDLKEDRNFLVGETLETPKQSTSSSQLSQIAKQYTPIFTQNIQWYSDSKHLITSLKDKIIIQEYDSTNKMTVYAGPIMSTDTYPFVYPWADGSKLIILTTLNKDMPANLYAVNLK